MKLVTGTSASVASCLNTIGRNVAGFTHLLADGFARAALWVRMVCGSAYSLAKKTAFATF